MTVVMHSCIKACVFESSSCNRMPVIRRVTSGCVVFELPFDIREHSACAETEQLGIEPAIAQLFFYKREPIEGLLCCANASGRFESHGHPGVCSVFANGTNHDQPDGQSGVHAFFSS